TASKSSRPTVRPDRSFKYNRNRTPLPPDLPASDHSAGCCAVDSFRRAVSYFESAYSMHSGNAMRASDLLVYRMPASRAQVRIALGVAAALFLVFIVTNFYGNTRFPVFDGTVALTSVILVMADWITATLLFAQARVLQARPPRV